MFQSIDREIPGKLLLGIVAVMFVASGFVGSCCRNMPTQTILGWAFAGSVVILVIVAITVGCVLWFGKPHTEWVGLFLLLVGMVYYMIFQSAVADNTYLLKLIGLVFVAVGSKLTTQRYSGSKEKHKVVSTVLLCFALSLLFFYFSTEKSCLVVSPLSTLAGIASASTFASAFATFVGWKEAAEKKEKDREKISEEIEPEIEGRLLQKILATDRHHPDEWFDAAEPLTIVLKDGKSYFSPDTSKWTKIKQRFSDKAKKTTILIVHPNFDYMEALEAQDSMKCTSWGDAKYVRGATQKQDIVDTITSLQNLRQAAISVTKETPEEFAARNPFVGYRRIPSWTGMIRTDENAADHVERIFVAVYPTSASRATLPSIKLGDEHSRNFQRKFKEDVAELIRNSHDPNLWSYQR